MVLGMATITASAEGSERVITIGTTYDVYWDSFDGSIDANPYYTGTVADEMMFAKVKQIEDKWNVKFDIINLTFTREPTTIARQCRTWTCIGWILWRCGWEPWRRTATSNYPARRAAHNNGDSAHCQRPTSTPAAAQCSCCEPTTPKTWSPPSTMPLAFNLQMVEDANLEDPRDLVERGEWTWEKFREYCKVLTKDTDGDGNIDVYGFGGWPGDYFMNFVMSNGTNVAATVTENLSSPEVGEVLQFIQDLNLVDKVMYPIPEENGWDVCRWLYRDGKVAFTPIAAWIMDSNKDYAFQHPEDPTLDFDMVFIPWPVGPHGNAETNAQKVTANACYVIPVGVEDPGLVYNVLYDLLNWYNYDPNSEDGGAAALAIRDDPETLGWWYGVTAKDIDLQDYNFEVMMEMGRHQMLDRYGSLGDDAELPLREFINGDYTTAQLQEKYRQTIQDAIDGILGK